MRTAARSFIVLIGLIVPAAIQAAAQSPSDQNVSIKPGQKGYGIPRSMGIDADHSLTVVNENLRTLILFAFDLRPYQLEGGPEWMSSDTFDIKAPSDATNLAEVRAGLQTLLTRHFRLKFHREMRAMPVYAMKIMHNGEGVGNGVWLGIATPSDGGRTLAQFASDLAGSLERPVVDATNPGGRYDLMPNSTAFPIPAIVPPDIGLKLDLQEGEAQVLVIDSVSKPEAEN